MLGLHTRCDKKETGLYRPRFWLNTKRQANPARRKVTSHRYCVAIILRQVIWFVHFRYFCNLVLVNLVTILLLGFVLVCRPCCLLLTSTKMEQRINLKFLVKLKKSPTEMSSSPIIRTVNLRSFRTSCFTLAMLSSVFDMEGRLDLGSSSTSSRPLLKRLCHSKICVLDITSSP